MAIRTFPVRTNPTRPQLRVLRSRRSWWTRFMDPREMFGLKVTMLLCCLILAALLGP